ncbi:MAG: tryptophan 7-halogenase [Planctomycetota bacterium]
MTSSEPNGFDVVIVGGGFAGSLLARTLNAGGLRVALIDRSRHPRFAIGESSTPLADLMLRVLGEAWGLSDLVAMSTYGSWKRTHPELRCGRKRGFSYYWHHTGRSYDDEDRRNSLLVAASPDNEVADTHWLRADVDAFWLNRAREEGVTCYAPAEVIDVKHVGRWQLQLRTSRVNGDAVGVSQAGTISAGFLVDAGGGAAGLGLQRQDCVSRLRSETRSVYAHYQGVLSWTQFLADQGVATDRDPFDGDDAAQHHLSEQGWMWMLRFDDGTTSVGWTEHAGGSGTLPRCPVEAAGRFPSLAGLFENASLIAPECCGQSRRLQRYRLPAADSAWAALPTAVATIDPMHSTGIAHALVGVFRLSRILLSRPDRRVARLRTYDSALQQEVKRLDQLVALAYRSLGWFEGFATVSKLYFMAAIRSEEDMAAWMASGLGVGELRNGLGDAVESMPFWLAGDPVFSACVDEVDAWVTRWSRGPELRGSRADAEIARSCLRLRETLQAYNSAGLFDLSVGNRYAYTAAAKPGVRKHEAPLD